MNRRSLIRTLFVAPFVTVLVPGVKAERSRKTIDLPIGCDLSLNSFRWACDIASKNHLGAPLVLVVGPENTSIARELLGPPPETPYTADSEINCLYYQQIHWHTRRDLPMQFWFVTFENGVVRSQGPY